MKKKVVIKKKKKVFTPPNKKIKMDGDPFVGRHTTG